MKYLFLFAFAATLTLSSCKRETEETNGTTAPEQVDLSQAIIESFAKNVAQDIYNSLSIKTDVLYQSILQLNSEISEENLATCRQNWRDARVVWEYSEAFLFGPVATEDIDPRIDTWPVNFMDLEGELNSTNSFTEEYIDGLTDELKGFHPIEYLLFGQDGNKTASELNERELEYLIGLALNLKGLTGGLAESWNPSIENNYSETITNPGLHNMYYEDRVAVYEEIVAAMAGICDEVANAKIKEPFVNLNVSLEESPFAHNSITDFKNNIAGVELVYKGKFVNDGFGLEDLVRKHNLALDGEIKLRIANAKASLNAISLPFGQAIFQQGTLVQNAIDNINALKNVIDNELLQLVSVYGN